jgi:hypothetical protein
MTVISEAGVYETILRSNLPEAKQLRRFVSHDVLPAIRKHGAYLSDTRWREVYSIYLDTRASVQKIQELTANLDRGDRRQANIRADILSAADDLGHTLGREGTYASIPDHIRDEVDREYAYNRSREIQLRNLPPEKVKPPLPPRPKLPPHPHTV